MIAIEQRKEIDLNLSLHEVVNINHPQPGLTIVCEKGVLWVTVAGDNNDHTLEAGESYVVQDTHLVVIEAVEKVMSGGLFFASSTPGKPPLSPLPAPAVTPLKNPLTPRELEVAVGVASGMSSKEIASKLDLSVRTVEKHRANIMDKVEVREVASLVRWCVQQGLIKV